MDRRKDSLEGELPAYVLEALVSTIDDREEMIAALRAANGRCSFFKRQA